MTSAFATFAGLYAAISTALSLVFVLLAVPCLAGRPRARLAVNVAASLCAGFAVRAFIMGRWL